LLSENDRIALMSVKQPCWDVIRELKARHPRSVSAAYGVHPWFAHQVSTDSGSWLATLRRFLEDDPTAIVGEIGLDKGWVPPDTGRHDWRSQLEVFEQQLALTVEMNRAVSLHSVGCHGFMFETLLNSPSLPPKMYLHSYTGSAAMVRSLARMKQFGPRFYFGFSNVVNGGRRKTCDAISAVPADRILLESDPEVLKCGETYRQQDLDKMLQTIAAARQWGLQETRDRTFENAERFYSRPEEVAV
jgi:TatD DNase family protein